MAKTTNVYARIEPEIKEDAENILAMLGITPSGAISMFYRQVIFHQGLPFEVQLPFSGLFDLSEMTEEQRNAELEKGYADLLAGRTRDASEAFSDIRAEFGL